MKCFHNGQKYNTIDTFQLYYIWRVLCVKYTYAHSTTLKIYSCYYFSIKIYLNAAEQVTKRLSQTVFFSVEYNRSLNLCSLDFHKEVGLLSKVLEFLSG